MGIKMDGIDKAYYRYQEIMEDPLIRKYFVMAVEGQSPLTLKAKKQDIERFLQYYFKTKGHSDLKDWYPADTRSFIESLKQKGYAPSSINRNLATLKSFGRWLRDENVISHNPTQQVRLMHLSPLVPKRIEDDEWQAIREVAEEYSTKSPEHERNFVLLRLLDGTGLRISELLNLKGYNVHFEKNSLKEVYCKGNRIRELAISKECSYFLHCFILSRKIGLKDHSFTNYRGEPLSRLGVAKAFNNIAIEASKRLGRPITITPHKFRHRHAFRSRMKFGDVWAAARRTLFPRISK
jgi:site-specific recombinase XerD